MLGRHPDTVPEAILSATVATEAERLPDGSTQPARALSWYVANFAATAGQAAGAERRTARWALRGLQRQPGVSVLPRVAACGSPIGNAPIRIKRDANGGAHVSGHETCSSVWSCPVCAASIRSHRADEITRGLLEALRKPTKAERVAGYKASALGPDQRNTFRDVRAYVEALPVYVAKRPKGLPAGVKVYINAQRAGQPVALPATTGGAILVTITLPHQAGDALARTFELVSDGFRTMQSGRAYAAERNRYGILGYVRSAEITHGANGWHPHLHLILVTAARLTEESCLELQAAWLARWNRYLTSHGWPPASDEHGVRFDLVRRDAAAVAVYVAKLQEGDATSPARRVNVANEAARADLKGGRNGSRVPFEVLADFGSDGRADDLTLWHEYQTATKGRSAIRWSRGLRDLLLPDDDELTDEQVTEQATDATDVAVIVAPLWRAVAARPYGEALLLVAAERGGLDGIRRYVRGLGLDPAGVHPPEAWTDFEQINEYDAERDEA